MKIRIDNNGNIIAVCIDSITLDNSISVPDNQDVLLNSNKYVYINGNIELKNKIEITTDKVDTNNNGIPDTSIGNSHLLTFTFKDKDNNILNISGDFLLKVVTQKLDRTIEETEYTISINGGIGTYSLTKNNSGIYSCFIYDFNYYCESINIEFI